MATYSSILAWKIPWTEEPGGIQPMGSQKSWTRRSDKQQQHFFKTGLVLILKCDSANHLLQCLQLPLSHSTSNQTSQVKALRRTCELYCSPWDFLGDDPFTVSISTRPTYKQIFLGILTHDISFWHADLSSFRISFSCFWAGSVSEIIITWLHQLCSTGDVLEFVLLEM